MNRGYDGRVEEWIREDQFYSHNLNQKLTFFVIGIELLICGYIMLKSEIFAPIKCTPYLFLLSGISAFFGLAWRHLLNQAIDFASRNKEIPKYKKLLRQWTYRIYVCGSYVFFASLIIFGSFYLFNFEKQIPEKVTAEQTIIREIYNDINNSKAMFSPEYINTIGLCFNILGVLLLLKYGIPNEVPNQPPQWDSDTEKIAYDKMKRWSNVGMGSIILGFILQIISAWIPPL